MSTPLPTTKQELRQLIAAGKNLGMNRPLNEIVADLSWPVPADFLDWKTKPTLIPYISHDVVCWILNYITPGWTGEIVISQVGNLCYCQYRLTIPTADGIISRDSSGSANLDDENYGGPLPEAESQAFRRAATKFGLGLYLYEKTIVETLVRRKKQEGQKPSRLNNQSANYQIAE